MPPSQFALQILVLLDLFLILQHTNPGVKRTSHLFIFFLFFCTKTSGLFASFDRSAWILKPHRILISDYRTDYRVFGNTIYCSFLGEGVHNARLSVLLWLFCHASSLCTAFEQASCAPPGRVSLPPQFRHTFCKLALYIANYYY